MSQKHRRSALKSKVSKQILLQASEKLKFSLDEIFGPKVLVETSEANFVEVFLIEAKPVLFKTGDTVWPTLLSGQIIAHLPRVIVDMGAVRFVCNGADVMSPGVCRYEGVFTKGDVVVVVDEKHGKNLAIGEILYDSEEVLTIKQGPVIRNKHHVGDKVWDLAKALSE